MKKVKAVQMRIRMPDDLHKKIKKLAETDSRSMHMQTIHIIREALKNG